MFINFKNLTIRNASASDAERLAEWWNDGKVMEHAGFPNGLGTNAEEVAKQISHDSDDTYRRLIIEIDGAPAGEMSYRNLGNSAAEIGIKICDFSMQDKGYGKILLSMLIKALFEDMGYNKILLDTNTRNKRAQHVYKKLGFQKMRINEDSWRNQVGELQSSVDYELTPPEFVDFSV